MIRIAFSGARPPKSNDDRSWTLWAHLLVVLEETVNDLTEDALVVQGLGDGVDKFAKHFAEKRGLLAEDHPADWNRYGKRAGPIRNVYVTTCPILHAFPAPWSVGTWDAIDKAEKAGITIINHAHRYWPNWHRYRA